jgi:hypothetical protein
MSRKLYPQDFDFRCCPEDELEACYRYEYLRESFLKGGSVANLVTKLRQILETSADKEPSPKRILAADLLPDLFEGPEIPWLKLNTEIRQKYLQLPRDFGEQIKSVRPTVRLETETSRCVEGRQIQWVDWKAVQEVKCPRVVCGWFAIRPGGRAEMKAQFSRELDRLERENPGLCTSKPNLGSDTLPTRLNQLGALRLLDGRTAGQVFKNQGAIVLNPDKINWLLPFTSEKGLREGSDKARVRLSEFEAAAQELLSMF